jgi:hypothetical protein
MANRAQGARECLSPKPHNPDLLHRVCRLGPGGVVGQWGQKALVRLSGVRQASDMANLWKVLGEQDLRAFSRDGIEAAVNNESQLGWELVTSYQSDGTTWFAFRREASE